MAYCGACGRELTSPVFRTREPRCYVFRGGPDDVRNGILLHTREGVTLGLHETGVIVPLEGEQAWHDNGWKPPKHENRSN